MRYCWPEWRSVGCWHRKFWCWQADSFLKRKVTVAHAGSDFCLRKLLDEGQAGVKQYHYLLYAGHPAVCQMAQHHGGTGYGGRHTREYQPVHGGAGGGRPLYGHAGPLCGQPSELLFLSGVLRISGTKPCYGREGGAEGTEAAANPYQPGDRVAALSACLHR